MSMPMRHGKEAEMEAGSAMGTVVAVNGGRSLLFRGGSAGRWAVAEGAAVEEFDGIVEAERALMAPRGGRPPAASINPRCWAPGQLYVALSRVRTAGGIHLLHEALPESLICSERVLRFYRETLDRPAGAHGERYEGGSR